MPGTSNYTDIVEAINAVADEINSTLDTCTKERYFDGLVLTYSLIENLLKWLVFVKLVWEIDRVLSDQEFEELRQFCKRLTFYTAQELAFSIGLIDWNLLRRVDAIRRERNDVIHQLWLYAHRGDNRVLRKKLEKVARVANDLVMVFNKLTEVVGVEEVYEIFM